MNIFTSYQEWRKTMIEHASLTLDRDYCTERLAILENENLSETRSFIKMYGATYHKQVIAWFNQALSEV